MKMTLDIAADFFEVVEDVARREQKSSSEVIIELVRRTLAGRSAKQIEVKDLTRAVYALPSLPHRNGSAVRINLVNELRGQGD